MAFGFQNEILFNFDRKTLQRPKFMESGFSIETRFLMTWGFELFSVSFWLSKVFSHLKNQSGSRNSEQRSKPYNSNKQRLKKMKISS